MSQILLILMFVLASIPETFGPPWFDLEPSSVAVWSVSLLFLVAVIAHVVIASCVRAVDRTGSWRAIRLGERAARWERAAAVMVHAFNVIGLGWVLSLRSMLGDPPLLVEVLAVLPPLLVWAASWWSVQPLERRMREAALVRDLDSGVPVYPIQSRGAFVWMSVRHQVLFVAVPIVVILLWGEFVTLAARHWGGSSRSPAAPGMTNADVVAAVVRVLGVGVMFVLMPVILRRIWSTTPLGASPLRDALLGLCERSGVRVRELLVWRTNGQLVNGAAVGLVRPLRYILLTDALLDRLSGVQIEAVAAHEIAHIRRHHMLWLGLSMLAAALVLGTLAEAAVRVLSVRMTAVFGAPIDLDALFSGPASLVMLGLTLAVLGVVSRRFEWQADAFAVAALSESAETTTISDGGGVRSVSPEAVHAMSSALSSVAALNGLSPRAPSWRHGSIATRQQKLRGLVGLPVDALPIDRVVRRIKLAVILAMVIGLGGSAIMSWLGSSSSDRASHGPNPTTQPTRWSGR